MGILEEKIKKNKYRIIFGVLLIYVMGGLATGGNWLIFFRPAFEGQIIDIESREPIEGAVVAAIYNCDMYGGTQLMSGKIGYSEAVTDKNGRFKISRYFNITGPLTVGNVTTFVIYKPGYRSIDGKNLEACFSSGCQRRKFMPSNIVFADHLVEIPKLGDSISPRENIPYLQGYDMPWGFPKLQKLIDETNFD